MVGTVLVKSPEWVEGVKHEIGFYNGQVYSYCYFTTLCKPRGISHYYDFQFFSTFVEFYTLHHVGFEGMIFSLGILYPKLGTGISYKFIYGCDPCDGCYPRSAIIDLQQVAVDWMPSEND